MSSTPANSATNIFEVSGSMAFFSQLICDYPAIWRRLSKLETTLLADTLNKIEIHKPVYVSGLARSGSTILLELLNEIPGVVSHCYKDFPPVFTPYAWNTLLRYMATNTAPPAERAHKDGIMVTLDSPEAMEEPLWMSFFPQAHDPTQSNIINASAADNGFAEFYKTHIRKLLAVHQGNRYLAKANYQITRLEYLLKLFPDARFVIPVREPAGHIASLMKQHDLFTRGQSANLRARKHLRRVGHYEFGLDRTPINTGNNKATAEVMALWENNEEVLGWSRYWNQIYTYIAERLENNPQLAEASQLVVFEQLCADPSGILSQVFKHCDFDVSEEFTQNAASRISAPGYYKSRFSDAELFSIARETGDTMERIKALAGKLKTPG
ncbi:MAG: sulfotransferase [Gammaproteobacteria bacterium]|nr:sulfotransferase [Gammaproteobacteria bacterium]MCP4091404.1 sulfotransferase [Gammaproteobacteria bacterium]MCP4275638.1 sulfotransferase [Gammaproteobacteria bacterium]MCP4831436.1 sulfotransferase [Gammaproteobacteria bacterium]MCP4930210.1 sulfotransferase [Gammaproteobacteria bacterium]